MKRAPRTRESAHRALLRTGGAGNAQIPETLLSVGPIEFPKDFCFLRAVFVQSLCYAAMHGSIHSPFHQFHPFQHWNAKVDSQCLAGSTADLLRGDSAGVIRGWGPGFVAMPIGHGNQQGRSPGRAGFGLK